MPITLTAEDLEFLKAVDERVDRGMTQEEIAEALQIPASTFRYRVRELGFQFGRLTVLEARSQFGGQTFRGMVEDGQIQCVEAVPA